jgi:hypothetical protein
MSTGAVIAVVVAVVVVLAIVAALVLLRGGGPAGSPVGLKRRFGPEYERTLARHDGDAKATRRELTERVKRYGGLTRQPLSAQARERYEAGWAAAQARFVDDPGQALNEAERLLAGLAAERGFPGPESPEHFDALSVHHPHEVQGYRYAHTLAEHGPAGPRGTEELRQALLGARGLFEALIADADPAAGGGGTGAVAAVGPAPSLEKAGSTGSTGSTGSAGSADVTGTERVDDADDVLEAGQDRRGTLSHRLAALTGGRRGQSGSGGQV